MLFFKYLGDNFNKKPSDLEELIKDEMELKFLKESVLRVGF